MPLRIMHTLACELYVFGCDLSLYKLSKKYSIKFLFKQQSPAFLQGFITRFTPFPFGKGRGWVLTASQN